MINDLTASTEASIERAAPVCIVGAGTAGLFLAQQLRQQGIRVLLLETGDALARRPNEIGQKCVQRGVPYRGADLGRSFGLGGTSALWGGQMIPLTASDMGARPALGIESWPIDYQDLMDYLPIVKRVLGLESGGGCDEEGLLQRRFPALSHLGTDFQLRLSQWLPFRTRNFAKTFAPAVQSDAGLEVWLNAAVVRLDVAPDGDRIVSVEARSPTGRVLVVKPRVLVVCAGALESTRLLLEFDEYSKGSLTNAGAPLGRYFSDHLSVTCGRFECHDWRQYNLETAPVFEKGLMRTPRLELSSCAQERLGVTSAFAHFNFVTHGDTGFDVVRNILRKLQGDQGSLGLSPRRLGRVFTDVSAMAYWRGIHQRLWIPRQADLLLQVDIEQVPNWNSRLSLSNELDVLGRKRLLVDWRIGSEDTHLIQTVAGSTIKAWGASGLRDIAQLHLTLPKQISDFETLYDVYHPTGTIRMGRHPRESTVDADLKIWGLRNCFISSTAVFPSAGSANPGLMHLALTARLADYIGRSYF